MRVVFAVCVALLLCCASSFRVVKKSEQKSNSSCVNFMIIGDYGSPKSAQARVAASMAQEAARVDAVAILGLGDNIYENGATSSNQMVREWRDVYMKHAGNKRPWYAVMGNHDWRTTSHAQRDFTKSSQNSGGHWNMPDYWYAKRFGNVEVFFVDTQVWRGSVSSMKSKISTQRNWLEGALQSSSAAWKIVVGHHPTYSAGNHGGSSDMKSELDPIMRRHGANIYFAGHDHSQQHIQHRNVNYIVSGSGSKAPRGRSDDYPSGSLKKYQGEESFASLGICDDSKATLKFFTARGSVEYTTTLTNDVPGPPSTSPSPSPENRRRRRRRRRRDSSAALAEETVHGPRDEGGRAEELGSADSPAVCNGVQLMPVDMRCSADGCTVQPDTDSSEISCEKYCSGHGLTCTGAWANDFEDCGLDLGIKCDELVMGSGAQVCQCGAPL